MIAAHCPETNTHLYAERVGAVLLVYSGSKLERFEDPAALLRVALRNDYPHIREALLYRMITDAGMNVCDAELLRFRKNTFHYTLYHTED